MFLERMCTEIQNKYLPVIRLYVQQINIAYMRNKRTKK